MTDKIAPWLAMAPLTIAVVGSQAPNGGKDMMGGVILTALFGLLAAWGIVQVIKDILGAVNAGKPRA